MSPKDLYYFLGKCLVVDEVPDIRQEIIGKIGEADFSWEQFVQVGSNHLVLPALYVKLRDADLLPFLPDELAMHMAGIHALNLERNRSLMKQAHWLIQVLQQADIHPVFLKGTGALLEDLYADPGERILSDIDCLVKAGDFEKAVQMIRAEGYSSPPFHPESLPMMHHYPSLFKTNEPAQIEVHRYPVGRRQLKYLNLEDIPDKSFTLSGRDQILINVIHSQLKDRGQYYANVPLRNIYDFYRLTRKYGFLETSTLHPRLRSVYNNYRAVAAKLFAPSEFFPHEKGVRTKLFIARLELNKSNRIYYRLSKLIRSMADLLYAYLFIIVKAMYQEDYGTYLRIRLKNPAWYKHHLSVVRKRFS